MKNENIQKISSYRGVGLVPGIGIGNLYAMVTPLPDFPQYWLEQGEIEKEISRFLKAVNQAKQQIQKIKLKMGGLGSTDTFAVLDSQLLLLGDELFIKNTIHGIRVDFINCEWALHNAISEICRSFENIGPNYLKQRQEDIKQVEEIILRELMGLKMEFDHKIPSKSVVLTHSLTPAQVVSLHRLGVKGLILNQAQEYSHSMILARAFKIPTVVNVEIPHNDSLQQSRVLVDGFQGIVCLNPKDEVVTEYKKIIEETHSRDRQFIKDAKLPALTQDGLEVDVRANMEVLDELDLLLDSGACGIGLFRSEFLFNDRDKHPGFEEQQEVYSTLLKKVFPYPVCIRTVDAGSEKLSSKGMFDFEINPALGLRAIRYSLKFRRCLEDQLKALLAASGQGNLEICLPLISTIEELRKVRRYIPEYLVNMKRKGYKVAPIIKVGIMIETPAAVMEADILASEADFISLGTNDLIQYTLAADRLNEDVAHLYSYYHPSIIRSLKRVVEAARNHGKSVTVCGEMAAETSGFLILLALGYRSFSMNPNIIPRIKRLARSVNVSRLEKLVSRMFEMSSYKEIGRYWETQIKSLEDTFDNS